MMAPAPMLRELMRRSRSWLPVLLLAAAAVLPFSRSLHFGYVYDDVLIIADRAELHGAGSVSGAWALPYWSPDRAGSGGLYRPVTLTIYASLWKLGGGSPLLFHYYELLLNLLATLGVYALLRRAAPWGAALSGALLFAVHPAHVEAVANIAGSSELLVTVGALAAVSFALRARDRTPREAPAGWGAAVGIALIYLLALGGKESAAGIPALVFACWWGWPSRAADGVDARERETLGSTLRRGWRVWLLSAVALAGFLALRWVVVGSVGSPDDDVAVGLRGLSTAQRLWTMTAAWPLVARLLVWPSHLVMHYGPSLVVPRSGPTAAAVASLVVAAAALGLGILLARRGERRPLVALAWIAVAYLPASNLLLPTGQLLAERTMYLATVGVAMLAALAVARAPAPGEARRASGMALAAAAAVVAVVAALGAARSRTGTAVWRDNPTLFRSGIAADPAGYRPYLSLADWYMQHDEPSRAAPLFERAYRLHPGDPEVELDVGRFLLQRGDAVRALPLLREGTRLAPRSPAMRVNYLDALLRAAGPDSLIAAVRRYRGDDPAGTTRYLFLARAFAARGWPDSVLAAHEEALARYPRDPTLTFLYAAQLRRAGRAAQARAELDRLGDAPGIPRATRLFLHAELSLELGDSATARADAAAALRESATDSAVARLADRLGVRADRGSRP